MAQMTMCIMKGVARYDEPIKNYHPTLSSNSTPALSFTKSFNVSQLTVLVLRLTTLGCIFDSVSQVSSVSYPGVVLIIVVPSKEKKSSKNLCYLQTDKISG